MKALATLAALSLLLTGCSPGKPASLGAPVSGPTNSVAALARSAVDAPVVLHGAMTQKCPAAGCWFMLKDDTGTIKVDTKNAGFVVLDVPLNSVVTVAGRVATNDAGRFLDATGLRY
jgi:uncharacterized protein YdeI (BOF family)